MTLKTVDKEKSLIGKVRAGPCGEFEDEKHALFNCSLVDRTGLNLNENLDSIWSQPDIFKLFNRIHTANFV